MWTNSVLRAFDDFFVNVTAVQIAVISHVTYNGRPEQSWTYQAEDSYDLDLSKIELYTRAPMARMEKKWPLNFKNG